MNIMFNNISKYIIVVGAGVMGSAIAAQIANAGYRVYLFDIVPLNAIDRNILARQAIEQLGNNLASKALISNIIPGNLTDNLENFTSASWVIEAITERLELKQALYAKLEQYCSKNCVISSNTSTILLSQLIKDRADSFTKHFLITHFFNPPRYMKLLELIASTYTQQETISQVSDFLDVSLGRAIIKSNDTPGFIANRIGCYWLEEALSLAIAMGLAIEEADALMGKPLGFPSTAIFGLYDLIGIDVMQLITRSLRHNLGSNDAFIKASQPHKIIEQMLTNGLTGRKAKGGFYRSFEGHQQAIDLKTGEYRPRISLTSPINGIADSFNHNLYVCAVLSKTLAYAASLIPHVSNSIHDIDQAMKLGYNWKFGPFELIDLIGIDHFIWHLTQQNIQIAPILLTIGNKKFYQGNYYFNDEEYLPIPRLNSAIFLNDFNNKVIIQNDSCRILDVGDAIATIEITNKMAIMNSQVFELMIDFITKRAKDYQGIVIANISANFSIGGDLKFMLEHKDSSKIDTYLRLGQNAMLALKYSPTPVSSAAKNLALGGGCELLLHSSLITAELNITAGLVEAAVGLVPSWGGCKELILRSQTEMELINAFKYILSAHTSNSAYELKTMLMSGDEFEITLNEQRLFTDAKAACFNNIKQTGPKFRTLKEINWNDIIVDISLLDYDLVIAQELATIFSQANSSEEELLQLERLAFMRLLKNPQTQARIEHMLATGKRLKN